MPTIGNKWGLPCYDKTVAAASFPSAHTCPYSACVVADPLVDSWPPYTLSGSGFYPVRALLLCRDNSSSGQGWKRDA